MSFLRTPISLFPVRPQRRIGEIAVQVILSENTTDKLTITKQPVQQGASITDHSFVEPTSLQMSMMFQDNPGQSLAKIYEELRTLQQSREPISVVTPKRIYSSMLIGTLINNTDAKTENCLSITMNLEEVILVSVSTTQVPRRKQRSPGTTGKTEAAGKKSALQSLKEGIGGVFR